MSNSARGNRSPSSSMIARLQHTDMPAYRKGDGDHNATRLKPEGHPHPLLDSLSHPIPRANRRTSFTDVVSSLKLPLAINCAFGAPGGPLLPFALFKTYSLCTIREKLHFALFRTLPIALFGATPCGAIHYMLDDKRQVFHVTRCMLRVIYFRLDALLLYTLSRKSYIFQHQFPLLYNGIRH